MRATALAFDAELLETIRQHVYARGGLEAVPDGRRGVIQLLTGELEAGSLDGLWSGERSATYAEIEVNNRT